MRRSLAVFGLLLTSFTINLFGQQHAVDPANRYYRVICLVHLTGSGKADDPIRPEYVPKASDAPSRDGIIAWSSQLTDDGKMAIVHLVAVNHYALDALLADKRPEIRVFEIGKHEPAAIALALKAVKANFSLESLRVVAR
jgi:hypothetical protein